jgi:hypothetical protein
MTTRQKRLRTITAAFALLAFLNVAASAETERQSLVSAMLGALVYSDTCPEARTHLTTNSRERIFRFLKMFPAETEKAKNETIAELDRNGKAWVCRAWGNRAMIDAIDTLNIESM